MVRQDVHEVAWCEQVLLKIRTCKLDDRVTKVIKSNEFCTSLEGLMVINETLPEKVKDSPKFVGHADKVAYEKMVKV